MEGDTVSVISTRTRKEVAEIPVGKAPVQVAFAPGGRFAYVSLNGENAVAKLDVRTRRVVGKTAVGVGPVQLFVTPNGRTLVVANQGTEERPSTTLSLVRLADFRRVADVETGKGAHGVVVDRAGARAYVTNIYGGDVAVVDLRARRTVERIRVGEEPNGVSFSTLAPAKARAAVLQLPLPAHPEGEGH
jgi:YVTN family beta-propeller protein